ncbi:MAG: GntR family transcriptional regulator [Alphaproteobacteria bacterium]|nr:GntR family transcriptional regulator [Alphaproteobacteria bacterium]
MPLDRLTAPADLAQRVYDALSDAIGSGALAPGERVTQEGLAERFGVSRQPVLQALLLLKRQGLIVDAGRKGVMVAPLDPIHVRRLYEVRAALDGAACRLAAARMDDGLRARGRRLLDAGDQAMRSGDAAALLAADIDFHLFLYEASGNPLFVETAAPHWRHLRRVMGAVLRGPEAYEWVWREHAAILAALVEGDGERAATLAIAHANGGAERLAPSLESKGAER